MTPPPRRVAVAAPASARRTPSARIALAHLALALVLALPRLAQAQTGESATPPTASAPLLDQLRAVGDALNDTASDPHQSSCTSRCFVLEHLQLTGSAAQGRLTFELRGAVLANGPVAVPLFGPAQSVRVSDLFENDHAATVGFEDGHYYLFTGARRFVLRGALALDADRALTIAGPVNAVDAAVSDGRLVEGERLSGVADLTVHFEDATRGAASEDALSAVPAVMQLTRALRFRRSTEFEYRLALRGRTALGVFRLPLSAGEEVLEVQGSTGWRVVDRDLVLPTEGASAEVTITGTLRGAVTFAPDPRSSTEWWLLESDAEHRIEVATGARRFDPSQSTIAATQAAAQLYLVARGQQLAVSVETLVAQEALATVVHSQVRTLQWTRDGELVSDDALEYNNSGTDYLRFAPAGRAVFLSEDGRPERLMRDPGEAGALLIPLRTGGHTLRVQSLHTVARSALIGRLALPMGGHRLNVGAASLRLGLPRDVHPLALLGGTRAWWFVRGVDGVALGVAFVISAVLLRGRARRALGVLVLGGLWFVSARAFGALVALALAGAVAWLAGRLCARGWRRTSARALAPVVVLAAAYFVGAPWLHRALGGDAACLSMAADEDRICELRAFVQSSRERETVQGQMQARYAIANRGVLAALTESDGAASATGGLELTAGAVPVALVLPPPDRSLESHAQMVTPEAPFRPVLVYATDALVYALTGLWLLALAALAALQRRALAALVARARASLERGAPGRERHAPSPEPITPATAVE